MSQADTFRTIASPCQGTFTQLRSRFLAFAYPIDSEDEATGLVKKLKNKYHDARHVAYAYQLGAGGESWRANDDGEPSGTAGKPIHAVLRSHDITDTLVAVVRYYGGTPLGAKNLGRAYAQAADDALSKAEIKTNILTRSISIKTDHSQTDLVLRTVRNAGGETRLEYTATNVIAHIDIALSRYDALKNALKKIHTIEILD